MLIHKWSLDRHLGKMSIAKQSLSGLFPQQSLNVHKIFSYRKLTLFAAEHFKVTKKTGQYFVETLTRNYQDLRPWDRISCRNKKKCRSLSFIEKKNGRIRRRGEKEGRGGHRWCHLSLTCPAWDMHLQLSECNPMKERNKKIDLITFERGTGATKKNCEKHSYFAPQSLPLSTSTHSHFTAVFQRQQGQLSRGGISLSMTKKFLFFYVVSATSE